MKNKKNKPRIAIVGLTSCEGCQFVILDQGKKFLDLLREIQLDEFRLIEDDPEPANNYDICFIEGNPVTKANINLLKEMRKRSKFLVALGNCAALGGVWELKNYQDKHKTIRRVYRKIKVENPDIKEIDNFVKVDLTIPGCPIDGDEFIELVWQLLKGRLPQLPQKPVCDECQKLGYECLLQKGKICLGPITLGGCKAVCLKSKQACWGCRGFFEGAQIENFMKFLLSKFSREQIYRVMEIFGARDSILKKLNFDIRINKKNKKVNIKK